LRAKEEKEKKAEGGNTNRRRVGPRCSVLLLRLFLRKRKSRNNASLRGLRGGPYAIIRSGTDEKLEIDIRLEDD